MKKLMIAAAIVCAAAFAQASNVSWAYSGDIYGKDGESGDYATGTGWVVYLGNDPSALGSWAIDATGAISTTDASLIQFDSGDSYVGVVDGLWNNGEASTSLETRNGYYDLVVAYQDPNDSKWYYASEQQQITALVGDPTANYTAEFSDEYAPMTVGTPVNVPEPTSGLLLLLGVAGMALRRRRA